MKSETGTLVSREALFLLTICLLDTVSSAYLFQHNMAVDCNPVLRASAEAGLLPFVSAKTATFIPAIMAAEWYRRRRPEFVLPLLRWAGVAYLAVYTLLVARQFIG